MINLEDIAKTLKRMEDEILTIKRGVYGDEPNGVKGLITTDQEQHIRIKKLENTKNKVAWFIAGAFALFEGLHWLKELPIFKTF